MHLMHAVFGGLAAVLALSAGAPSARADTAISSQSVYVGPGGVEFEDGHSRWRSHRRRGSDGGGYHRRWESERGGRAELCARLRRACVNKEERGETGEGNCRRYRRVCR